MLLSLHMISRAGNLKDASDRLIHPDEDWDQEAEAVPLCQLLKQKSLSGSCLGTGERVNHGSSRCPSSQQLAHPSGIVDRLTPVAVIEEQQNLANRTPRLPGQGLDPLDQSVIVVIEIIAFLVGAIPIRGVAGVKAHVHPWTGLNQTARIEARQAEFLRCVTRDEELTAALRRDYTQAPLSEPDR